MLEEIKQKKRREVLEIEHRQDLTSELVARVGFSPTFLRGGHSGLKITPHSVVPPLPKAQGMKHRA